ncbi:hypothetical protein JCM18897A_33290 [Streptomyces sp. JCM 18897]
MFPAGRNHLVRLSGPFPTAADRAEEGQTAGRAGVGARRFVGGPIEEYIPECALASGRAVPDQAVNGQTGEADGRGVRIRLLALW